MRLLPKPIYDKIESLLRTNTECASLDEPYKSAINEIVEFFNVPVYRDFLQIFYFDRYKYINRYPDNRLMLRYLHSILFIQESTLYAIRKEIVYKSAMIFYKYKIIE